MGDVRLIERNLFHRLTLFQKSITAQHFGGIDTRLQSRGLETGNLAESTASTEQPQGSSSSHSGLKAEIAPDVSQQRQAQGVRRSSNSTGRL